MSEPTTEAGQRAAMWMRSYALGNPSAERAVALIYAAEIEAERRTAEAIAGEALRLREALFKVWELWPTTVFTEDLLNEVETALGPVTEAVE